MAIAETSINPRQVFSNLTNKLAQEGEILNVKQYTLARQIQRDRQAQAGRPKTPNTYQEVLELLPDDLKKCLDGSEFLAYGGNVHEVNDLPDNATMLVFCSIHAKERMRMSRTWLCDGTFKSAPSPFAQVFILIIIVIIIIITITNIIITIIIIIIIISTKITSIINENFMLILSLLSILSPLSSLLVS